MGRMKNEKQMLVERPEGKTLLCKHKHKGEDNIKMVITKMEPECGLDSSGPECGPKVGSCKHGNEPSCSVKCGEFLD
jgi:hypothetical protein